MAGFGLESVWKDSKALNKLVRAVGENRLDQVIEKGLDEPLKERSSCLGEGDVPESFPAGPCYDFSTLNLFVLSGLNLLFITRCAHPCPELCSCMKSFCRLYSHGSS